MSVDLATGVKFLKVEKVKEFESFRQIPKFQHVPYAVIHPSPRKRRDIGEAPACNLNMSGSQVKIQSRRYEAK